MTETEENLAEDERSEGWRLLGLAASVRRVLGERFDRSPIADAETLARFVRTRSAHVAQTAMYGYLKTRMGTSFRRHFEDDAFASIMRDCAIRLFVSCLSDLTVFAVATAAAEGRLNRDECVAMARGCFYAGLAEALEASDSAVSVTDALAQFDARARATDWAVSALAETAFAGSIADLIRFAPVVDEYKAMDDEIVRNSMRFRWREVRERFHKRIDSKSIVRTWRTA